MEIDLALHAVWRWHLNDIPDHVLNVDSMYYDGHSEVDFVAILRLPRFR